MAVKASNTIDNFGNAQVYNLEDLDVKASDTIGRMRQHMKVTASDTIDNSGCMDVEASDTFEDVKAHELLPYSPQESDSASASH
eukprot:4594673-Karenia_brevis.AAC.1